MNYRALIASVCMAGFAIVANSSHAQEMDIDQADSLNFQSFHTDKKEAVKVWDKPSETTKAYSEQPAKASQPTNTAGAAGTASAVAATTAVSDVKGKRFEMRERYTLTRSTQTPYSAFFVIEPLYKQAAQLCPRGWKKLAERSEPIDQDYYLYYEVECL